MADDILLFKTCPKCGEYKSRELFGREPRAKSGIQNVCTACETIRKKSYALKNAEKEKERQSLYKANNRDKLRVSGALYREANKERIKIYTKANYEKNKDKKAAYAAAYNAANPELSRARLKKWRSDNPEMYRASKHRRRARVIGAIGTYTSEDIKSLITLQRFKCAICGVCIKNKYHIDHVIPLSRGGSNDKLNLQLLCPSCNVKKSSKHPIDYMQQRGFLL